MDPETRAHVKRRSTWTRLLYVILFAVIFNITEAVIVLVFIFQFLSKLVTGRVHEQVQALGGTLAVYLSEIVRFITFNSDDMPYPFAAWPKDTPAPKRRGPTRRRGPKMAPPAPAEG